MSDETPQNDQQDNLANLRKAADEGTRAKAELEQAKRELAFAKAGVDTESGVGALLFKAYDGELTVEAIKAQASELGIGAPPAEPGDATPPPPAVDTSQTQARLDLAQGSAPAGTPDVSPYRSALSAFDEAVQSGLDEHYAAAAAYQKIIEAANAGDRRVLL